MLCWLPSRRISSRRILSRWVASAGATAIALGLVAACGGGAAEDPTPSTTIRDVMYQIEYQVKRVEPSLRNPEKLDVMQDAAEQILTWIENPSYVNYARHESFQLDPDLFEQYRDELREATRSFSTAAQAADMEGLYEGFLQMNQTCVRCHKRFDPTY